MGSTSSGLFLRWEASCTCAVGWPKAPRPASQRGRALNVAPITQPASTVSPIEVKGTHPAEGRAPSYRQDRTAEPIRL